MRRTNEGTNDDGLMELVNNVESAMQYLAFKNQQLGDLEKIVSTEESQIHVLEQQLLDSKCKADRLLNEERIMCSQAGQRWLQVSEAEENRQTNQLLDHQLLRQIESRVSRESQRVSELERRENQQELELQQSIFVLERNIQSIKYDIEQMQIDNQIIEGSENSRHASQDGLKDDDHDNEQIQWMLLLQEKQKELKEIFRRREELRHDIAEVERKEEQSRKESKAKQKDLQEDFEGRKKRDDQIRQAIDEMLAGMKRDIEIMKIHCKSRNMQTTTAATQKGKQREEIVKISQLPQLFNDSSTQLVIEAAIQRKSQQKMVALDANKSLMNNIEREKNYLTELKKQNMKISESLVNQDQQLSTLKTQDDPRKADFERENRINRKKAVINQLKKEQEDIDNNLTGQSKEIVEFQESIKRYQQQIEGSQLKISQLSQQITTMAQNKH